MGGPKFFFFAVITKEKCAVTALTILLEARRRTLHVVTYHCRHFDLGGQQLGCKMWESGKNDRIRGLQLQGGDVVVGVVGFGN